MHIYYSLMNYFQILLTLHMRSVEIFLLFLLNLILLFNFLTLLVRIFQECFFLISKKIGYQPQTSNCLSTLLHFNHRVLSSLLEFQLWSNLQCSSCPTFSWNSFLFTHFLRFFYNHPPADFDFMKETKNLKDVKNI